MASAFIGGPAFGGFSRRNEVISAATLNSLPIFNVQVDENGPIGNFNPIRPLPLRVVQGMSMEDYYRFNA